MITILPSPARSRWLPLLVAGSLLAPFSSVWSADRLFELNFENGLAAGGSLKELTVAARGGMELEMGDGRAWHFDGATLLEVPVASREILSFGPDDVFTLRLRVRLERSLRFAPLISKGSGSAYRLSVSGEREVTFSYYAAGSWRSYPAEAHPLPQDEWADVAVQYHGGERLVTLLINGQLAARLPVDAPLQSRDEAPLYIGGAPAADSEEVRGIQGDIDDIRIDNGLVYPGAGEAEIGSSVEAAE